MYENTEIGVVLESREVAENMARKFNANISGATFRLELRQNKDGTEQLLWHGYEDGKEKVFTADPYTSFWRRLGIGLMRLLPIESQL